MASDRIVKRVYMGECKSSRLVGQLRKGWNDSVNDCLKKGDLNEWWEFVRGTAWGIARG